MPKENVMYTIVIESKDKQITDFVSFYLVQSTILKDESGHGHKEMNVSILNLFLIPLIYFRLLTCTTTLSMKPIT
jgi:hypothetical protein